MTKWCASALRAGALYFVGVRLGFLGTCTWATLTGITPAGHGYAQPAQIY